MLGIGKTWRVTVRNVLGVDIAAAGVTINQRLVKFDTSGVPQFGSDSVLYTNAGVISSTTYASSTEQDNSTDKWLGGDFVCVLVAPSASNGYVEIYYERKVNGQWPTSGRGLLLTQINVTTTGTYQIDFSI